MSGGRSIFAASKLDMSERTRMHAYWVGILGLCFAAFLYSLAYLTGKDIWLARVVIPSYAVILGIITLSAHRNFHVRWIFFNGCILIAIKIYPEVAFFNTVKVTPAIGVMP